MCAKIFSGEITHWRASSRQIYRVTFIFSFYYIYDLSLFDCFVQFARFATKEIENQ